MAGSEREKAREIPYRAQANRHRGRHDFHVILPVLLAAYRGTKNAGYRQPVKAKGVSAAK